MRLFLSAECGMRRAEWSGSPDRRMMSAECGVRNVAPFDARGESHGVEGG